MDEVYLFKAVAPNITFTHCHHHNQTVEVTEEDAKTREWYDMRDRQRFECESCGESFSAQGGQFLTCSRDAWKMWLKSKTLNNRASV